MNRRHLKELPRRARSLFGKWPVHVVEPRITVSQRKRKLNPELPIVLLPEMEFAALFTSFPPRDKVRHASRLVIVWHQDEPYPVISEESRAKLADLAWDALATDFDY